MREACDVLLADLDGLAEAIRDRALEHRRTPMIGRTHGVHAEPMTFGLKLALWYAEVGRDIDRIRRARAVVRVGKLSGAVGTFAHLPPAIEEDVCRRLGLDPAPVASQVIQRDRHAELLAAIAITGASLEKFALEIRGLQKAETVKSREFGKASSATTTSCPIGCEQIVGCALLPTPRNVPWRARHLASPWSVILPDFIAGSHAPAHDPIARGGDHPAVIENLNARASSFRGPFCSSSRRKASRANWRTTGCSATRCARSPSRPISSSCCSPTPTWSGR
jgi:hypothetical protein